MRHTRTTTVALAAAVVLLTGCTSSSEQPTEPATSAPAASEPALTQAEITEQCVDAIAERAANTTDAEVPSDPTPKPCTPLSDSDYLDAYMDGIQQANEAARERLQEEIEGAE